MADGFADAFDEVSESDEATNALFRQAQSLDDTKRYAEGLFHEGSLIEQPVVQGETDLARAVWDKTEQMAGGDVVGKAAEGFEMISHGDPADVWEEIEPKGQSPYLDVSTDRLGTVGIESAQWGGKIIDSMNPASTWWPAAQAVRDEWPEAQKAMNGDPEHGIPFKNPEIPDTDAVVGDEVTDAVVGDEVTDAVVGGEVTDEVVATPDVDDMVTSYPTDGAFDASASDTPTYDAPSFDASSYDTSADSGGAFGSTSDDTGSSFTDF
jgi:hypothetical protein